MKLSILLLYMRLFKSSPYHVVFYVVGAYAVIWFIGSFVTSIFQCQPIRNNWDTLQACTSIDRNAFLIWNAITNIIGDVLVLISPIPIVWKLHNSWAKKALISCVFMLGALYVSIELLSSREPMDPNIKEKGVRCEHNSGLLGHQICGVRRYM